MAHFETIDFIVFIIYVLVIMGAGLWLSRTKKGKEKTSQDYFLADRSLTWWAIGASLIAANISAEHFIAMSGSGFAVGMAIAAYEWAAAIILIFVAKFMLPVFLDKQIYTMPQFLQQRFNRGVSTAFAFFWLLVYIFVNLTSVTYLGALALENILGVPLLWGIWGLALFSGIYSVYGGLKAVAWTDVIQVIFLVGGGLVTTWFALDAVSLGHGPLKGMQELIKEADNHFTMILEKGTVMVPDGTGGMKDAFLDLPGLTVIFGAIWISGIAYWGFNQYIIQKGLAAKNLREARRGLLFAGYLKLLMPLLVVVPGIAAYVLFQKNSPAELAEILGKPVETLGEIHRSDDAYPWLLRNFVPAGIKGLAFAALVAAIVSSLASMVNSTSTIFTIDIYKNFINREAGNRQLVLTGRIVAVAALLIAVLVAPQLATLDQAFQYIQEYTGFIAPGVVVVFFMGLFWKQATARAALYTAIATLPLGFFIKWLYPELPFLLRMSYIFIVLCFIGMAVSLLDSKRRINFTPISIQDANRRSMGKQAYALLATGFFLLIAGLVYSGAFAHLAFESIFMLATACLFLGAIILMSFKLPFKDHKAIDIEPDLSSTDRVFNIWAIGIVVIFTALYYFLW
ncbi:MAG: sodium/sugar symporter [Cyclobacteriaceae bacterium]|nr:sodium/sugar symporter [Cyclobacteriaceae bacterium]